MRYFAYGSNLDPAQMRARCPSARFIAVARLPDHRFCISRRSTRRKCGVADVVPSAGSQVFGVVFEISDADRNALDREEGVSVNAYKRVAKTVFADGPAERAIDVEIYVAIPQSHPPAPSREYLDMMITAARFWGLPDDYVQEFCRIGVDG